LLILFISPDYKLIPRMTRKSRQTLWRLKKELLEIGIPEEIVLKLNL